MQEIEVYGVDHSPWVQAVLLGLHEKGLPHRLVTAPPFGAFFRSGAMMPAARFEGEGWMLESSDILQRVGYEPISGEDLRAIYGAWGGVLHRPDRALRFFRSFAIHADPEPSWFRRCALHARRSFVALYMFVLIRGLVRSGRAPADPDDFAEQFLHWQRQLEGRGDEFLGGADPDMRDLMLFGVVQCHASIPVPPLAALREDPRLDRLREWIAAMQRRFADYPHVYSGVYFAPERPAPEPSTPVERAAFWAGLLLFVLALPLTLATIGFYAARARRTPDDD